MSATSASVTSVDLSRLPAPTVVELLSYEEIFALMVARLQNLLPSFDATIESDPAVKVLQVAAYREMLIRQDFNDRVRQNILAYAVDSNLDHIGALVGVVRLVVTPADPLAGTPEVLEDDEALRRRIVLAPKGFSVAGPSAAYIYHALTADASILDASAISPAPGQVRVSLLSRFGTGEASPDQIEAVEDVLAVIGGNAVRPLTDQVTVISAVIIDYMVDAALYVFSGPDEALILEAAQLALAAYLASCRRLGRDVTRSGIYAALHVEGVQRVVLAQPAADVVINDTQAANCVGTNLMIGGYDD